jgi:hypothetical protein
MASHVALVAKVIGMADAAGSVTKAGCMLFSVLGNGRKVAGCKAQVA